MRPLSQRGEIRLGFRCNARCGFCYYQDLLDIAPDKEPPTSELLDSLRVLKANGATEVEFTGGEPTIKPDLALLIREAKDLGFSNVSIITNGLRMSKMAYAKQLVDAGVDDVLFSIHGHTAELHDEHTKIPGSFVKIVQALKNMQSLGVRCRVSSTVTGKNYQFLSELFEFFLELRAACMHFAVFSPVAQAEGTDPDLFVSYPDAADGLKQAIDKFATRLPPLSIKYIPFCFLDGYEQYVMNLYQQNFDPDDWNYYLSNKVRRARGRVRGALFDAMSVVGFLFARDRRVALRYGFAGMKVFGFTRIVEMIRKKRLPQCRSCKYDNICDHVWRNYLESADSGEIKAVAGEKIRHPADAYVMANYRDPGLPLQAEKIRWVSV